MREIILCTGNLLSFLVLSMVMNFRKETTSATFQNEYKPLLFFTLTDMCSSLSSFKKLFYSKWKLTQKTTHGHSANINRL